MGSERKKKTKKTENRPRRGRSSVSPGRSGRSPTRKTPVQVSHPLTSLSAEKERDSANFDFTDAPAMWSVCKAENQYNGIAVHIETVKRLGLHPGSLVIVYPSLLLNSADQPSSTSSLPIIIAPIYISTNCDKSNIFLKKWHRETLRTSMGASVRIIPYIPSPRPISLEFMKASSDKTKFSFEQMRDSILLLIQPLDTAESITIVSMGTKPLSDSLHSLVLGNLLTRKFISTKTKLFINFFGQKYSFEIKHIESPSHSIKFANETTETKQNLQVFAMQAKTQIRIQFDTPSASQSLKRLPVVIGGLNEQLKFIQGQIQLCLFEWQEFSRFGLKAPRGILLYGPPGTGKTLMVKVIAEKLKCSLFIINGPEIMGKVHGESESRLRDVFEQARRQQPSLIFIDEIDAICAKRESLESEFEKRIVSQLLSSLDQLHEIPTLDDNEINSKGCSVVVLAATNRPNALDSALRRPGRFDREIEIGIPNPDQRREIIDVYMQSVKHSLNSDDLNYFAASTHGYVGADIASLCREACIHSLLRSRVIETTEPDSLIKEIESKEIQTHKDDVLVSAEDMKRAMAKIRPSAMRELMIEVPHVSWEDIGGNEEIKQNLKEAVEWPLRYPEAFERMGIRAPRGILLYGPPGCSKTMMAKALATESGLNFIAVKGPELFSKWVGESERAIRELFRKARAAAPSIVFFDEIDALAITRGGSDAGGVADRVLSQLLTELDGVEPLKKVTVVAATNRPDIIDKALLRPGRIDRVVYVGLPDEEARKHIIQLHLSKIPSSKIDLQILVEKTEKYSGAEVVAVCREASMFALTENIDIDSVTMSHFLSALEKVKPRISQEMIAFYANFQQSIKL